MEDALSMALAVNEIAAGKGYSIVTVAFVIGRFLPLGDALRKRRDGVSVSAPLIRRKWAHARWLGDIRTYFPASVVQVMQRDQALLRIDASAHVLR